jgi:type II secretory pathway component PulK
MKKRRNDEKGAVLVVVLWILLILVLIAWGLGRRSYLEVSLSETYQGKLRSYAAARAGMNTILDLLQRSPTTKDTLYSAGIAVDQSSNPQAIFSHMEVDPNSYAMVQWRAKNFSFSDPQTEYGLRDEEGKINLNAIGITNYQILSCLLQIQGLSQPEGDKLAMAIVNYSGTNAAVSNNNSFMSLDHALLKPKNRHYENILELLEVDGMTKDIFNKIKDDLTVYGDIQNGLWINLDTANNDVLQAVADAAARTNPTIDPENIVSEAYAIRDGGDAISFTTDDGVSSISSINDADWPPVLKEGRSNYYRVRVIGVDATNGIRTVLEAVIHQTAGAPGKIIFWQRD